MRLPKVLFLCTGNSCRSQMAEGWARTLASDRFEAFSAGISPCFVHPLAIKVMREAGVDISGQYSKHVEDLDGIPFDYVVTLCGHADENCPSTPLHGKRVHRPFFDPVFARGTDAQILESFRLVRDLIRLFVEGMPENLGKKGW
jgi:arsenate reductase (thioredoxin)